MTRFERDLAEYRRQVAAAGSPGAAIAIVIRAVGDASLWRAERPS